MTAKRDYRLDNIRGALIFLVVFCHLLVELPHGPLVGVLYQVVYLFHMPAFVFVTGYFARFRPRKMAAGFLLPYAVFQVLSIARRNLVAGRMWATGMTLLDPQWTLWYLPACLLWYCTIPLLDRATARKTQATVVATALVLSCVSGFAPWLGDFLDLARVVALFPFFVAGYYAGRHRVSAMIDAMDGRRLRMLRVASICAVGMLMALHYLHGTCPAEVLYRNTPFGGMWDFEARVIIQVVAVAFCLMLLLCAPQRDLGALSVAGRNTMSIYLLHPWVVRAFRHVPPMPGPAIFGVGVCVAIAAAILVLLGNDRVGTAFRYVFGGGWLKQSKA